MYKDSKRTCTAIVLLIKPFVWWRSRCRCRRGFVNPLIALAREIPPATQAINLQYTLLSTLEAIRFEWEFVSLWLEILRSV